MDSIIVINHDGLRLNRRQFQELGLEFIRIHAVHSMAANHWRGFQAAIWSGP